MSLGFPLANHPEMSARAGTTGFNWLAIVPLILQVLQNLPTA